MKVWQPIYWRLGKYRTRLHIFKNGVLIRKLFRLIIFFATKDGEALSVQFSSVAQLCPTLCNPMDHSMPGLPIHHQLLFIESVMPSNHLVHCRPLLLLPSIFPSIRVFSNESALCIRWPKYWSFSFNISTSNEHPGLISFRMDWLDLLAVQGTLKGLLQHHSSKASAKQDWELTVTKIMKSLLQNSDLNWRSRGNY